MRGSSWLSSRIQLFPEWNPLLPKCVISLLWAHSVLGPGHTSRGMRQLSLEGCLLSTQRASSPAGHSEKETQGGWDCFQGEQVARLGRAGN